MSEAPPEVKYLARVHRIADRYCVVGIRHSNARRIRTALNMLAVLPWTAMRHADEDCAAFDRALGRKA